MWVQVLFPALKWTTSRWSIQASKSLENKQGSADNTTFLIWKAHDQPSTRSSLTAAGRGMVRLVKGLNKVRTKSSVSLQVNQPLLVVFLLLIGAREDSNLKFVFILKQAAHLQKPKKYIKEIHKLFSFTRQSEYIYFSRNMLKTLNPYATKQIMHCIWQSLAHWLKISGWKKKKKTISFIQKSQKSLELSHY